jgi:hypothetical protein
MKEGGWTTATSRVLKGQNQRHAARYNDALNVFSFHQACQRRNDAIRLQGPTEYHKFAKLGWDSSGQTEVAASAIVSRIKLRRLAPCMVDHYNFWRSEEQTVKLGGRRWVCIKRTLFPENDPG